MFTDPALPRNDQEARRLQAIIEAAKARGQIQRRAILHGLDQAQENATDHKDGAIIRMKNVRLVSVTDGMYFYSGEKDDGAIGGGG